MGLKKPTSAGASDNFIPLSDKGVAGGVAVLDDSLAVEKSVGDSDGNNIKDTYATKTALDDAKKLCSDGKNVVASAITDLGITLPTDATYKDIVSAINKIVTLDKGTADATATAGQILSGATAYVKGKKVTGSIASRGATTITPSTSNQTIASGQYLSGAQTIKGDANLLAKNIRKGVSIFGVAGNLPVFDKLCVGELTVTRNDLSSSVVSVQPTTNKQYDIGFQPDIVILVLEVGNMDKEYYSTSYKNFAGHSVGILSYGKWGSTFNKDSLEYMHNGDVFGTASQADIDNYITFNSNGFKINSYSEHVSGKVSSNTESYYHVAFGFYLAAQLKSRTL